MGNGFGDGWVEAGLDQSGFAGERICDVSHIRPFLSIIGLCVIVWLFQIVLGPQDGEKPRGRAVTFGVFGSRTGIWTSLSALAAGSSTGIKSVLSSEDP